jgi:membrane fusion protein, macrolide-specific efflux system
LSWRIKVVVALLLLGGGVAAAKNWLDRPADGPASRSVTAVRGGVEATVSATGVVQPQNRLEIKPPIAGRAEAILVREGETVRKGQLLAWMSSTERAALLDAARARGAEVLAHWEELFKPTPLVAPLDGRIIARNVEPGQTVTSQDAVLVMSDRLIIKAQVDETDIAQVQRGQPAQMTLDAYPRELIHGTVDHIRYEAVTVNNVTIYEVDLLPERTPAFMRSGMTANVTFVVSAKPDALLLPAEAIRTDAGRFVVLRPGPVAGSPPDTQPVEIGINDGKQIEIVSGLREGDQVLVPEMPLPTSSFATPDSPLTPGGRRKR